jgi:hypothetical protein
MSDKLNTKKVAIALACVFGIISIICSLLLAIAPEFTTNLFGAMLHGLDISKIAVYLTFGKTILGIAETIILGLIIGGLFAVVYNKIKV